MNAVLFIDLVVIKYLVKAEYLLFFWVSVLAWLVWAEGYVSKNSSLSNYQ